MKIATIISLIVLITNSIFAIEPPLLLSPENGAIDKATELTLDWEAVSGAKYQVKRWIKHFHQILQKASFISLTT